MLMLIVLLTSFLIFIISLRKMEYGLYILIFLIPIFPKIPLLKISGTYIPARADDIFVFAVALALIFKLGKKEINLRNPLNNWLGIFLGVGFISTLFGIIAHEVNPLLGFLHFLKRIEYISLFYITFSSVKNIKQIKKIFWLIIATCVIVIFYGILQWIDIVPIFSSMYRDYLVNKPLFYHEYQRVISTFSGPYDFAAFLIMMVLINFSLLIQYGTKKAKSLFALLIVLCVVLIYATYSRTPVIALVLGIALTLIFLRKWKWLFPSFILATAPVIFFKKMIIRMLSTGIINKPADVSSGQAMTGISKGFDMSAYVRFVSHWTKAFNAFLHHPLLGAGYGSLGEAIDGDYVRMLGETGLIGLISFSLVIYMIFKIEWKTYRMINDRFNKAFTLGIMVSTIALLVDATFIDIFEASKIACYFWMLTGVAFKIYLLSLEKSKLEDINDEKTPYFSDNN